MKFKANFLYKPSNFQMDDCQIEKAVELSPEEFGKLKIIPLEDQPCVAENKRFMFSDGGVMHCLLALERGGHDGVLVMSAGYGYPRYAAYIPGMRDIVSAELDRAAEYIVRKGLEQTGRSNASATFSGSAWRSTRICASENPSIPARSRARSI